MLWDMCGMFFSEKETESVCTLGPRHMTTQRTH